jgi:hypothetical protein
MFVKVVSRSDLALLTAIVHETGGNPVSWGTHYFYDPPAERAETEYSNLGPTPFFLHLDGIEEKPEPDDEIVHRTNIPDGPVWKVRFAYWDHPHTGRHMVCTSGQIYLLSDTGATVDRV